MADINGFKKFLADKENCYYIGVGDIMDDIIAIDKRYAKSQDDTEGDDIIDQQIEKAYSLLSPYKEKIIGLGEGNHERTIAGKNGTNPIKRLCKELGCEYLGYSFLVRLVFHENNARFRHVIIYGNHGWGGGSRTEGGSLTKYAKTIGYYDADIYLFGHDHTLVTKPSPRLSLVGEKLIAKDRHICICGTFLKTVSVDENPTWAETRGFNPARIGGVTISIKPNGSWCDIKATA